MKSFTLKNNRIKLINCKYTRYIPILYQNGENMTPLLSCGLPDADILRGNVLGLSYRFAPMQICAFHPNPIPKFIILNI